MTRIEVAIGDRELRLSFGSALKNEKNMVRLTVDDALRKKLGDLSVPVELCDDMGRVLAHVVPCPATDEYELHEPPMEERELQRRENSNTWYTTEQVLERLRAGSA